MNSIVARDMTHTLTITLADAADLAWAQRIAPRTMRLF